jgi:two-component system NtrC family sensor kinase
MMPVIKTKLFLPGIALRLALLTWQESLRSKAKGLAVSLNDDAAAAAINEDYAGVVDACRTLLAGDPEIEFLVVLKNDGFALVNRQDGWRVEQLNEVYWQPSEETSQEILDHIPLFGRRAFHLARRISYSGIQWGWIHVGLSLKTYDQNVATLYRNTAILGGVCAILSLLLSLGYASQLVRPVLHLRRAVEKVAKGDLSVRVNMPRSDELGSLARSVNTMTESLLRRDQILESVRYAAQQFMLAERWDQVIAEVLSRLGRAADASRAYLFENFEDRTGRLYTSQRYEWTAQDIAPQLYNPDLQMVPYDTPGLDHWWETLENNRIISGKVAEMSPALHPLLEPQGILSMIVIPVFVNNHWWGFLGLDDCVQARTWTDAEKDSLRAATDMLGATIARQGIQEALLEAKATLEQRVEERTKELRTQVSAKEKALADLANAQSSLLEASRAAGMAEVATGVLHNVGNVLNSVNISSTLIIDQLQKSRIANVAKVSGLLQEHAEQLPFFFSDDSRGRQLPAYLASLASKLKDEQQLLLREAETLRSRIDHIKEIVAMQQSYGRVAGVSETVHPSQLMEDAIKLNAGALERHGVAVERQYLTTAPITTDKHKVLQILLNLINNAKYACSEIAGDKNITLRIDSPESGRIRFQVVDNGIGIASENLNRIFQHGFTTRKSGHGFGLHSGALAARELGGNLSAHSDGHLTGATFSLELPCQPGETI